MIASKPGAEDVEAMNNRQEWLEELFFLDGRDMISHPQRGRAGERLAVPAVGGLPQGLRRN